MWSNFSEGVFGARTDRLIDFLAHFRGPQDEMRRVAGNAKTGLALVIYDEIRTMYSVEKTARIDPIELSLVVTRKQHEEPPTCQILTSFIPAIFTPLTCLGKIVFRDKGSKLVDP